MLSPCYENMCSPDSIPFFKSGWRWMFAQSSPVFGLRLRLWMFVTAWCVVTWPCCPLFKKRTSLKRLAGKALTQSGLQTRYRGDARKFAAIASLGEGMPESDLVHDGDWMAAATHLIALFECE